MDMPTSGPASLWSLKELRSLHGQDDALRGPTFSCRIAGTDRKKNAWYLYMSSWTTAKPTPWLACSVKTRFLLQYRRPLPKSFDCSPSHPPSIGITSDEDFRVHMSEPLGKQVFEILFYISSQLVGFQPPYGWRCCVCSTESPLFLLSSLSDSRALLCGNWRLRKLTKHKQRDYADSRHLDVYLLGLSPTRPATLGTSTTSPTTLPLWSSLLYSILHARSYGNRRGE